MTSTTTKKGKTVSNSPELEAAHRKLQQATADAVSAARSLEREMKMQRSANEELQRVLEGRQRAASDSLANAARLVAAVEKPSDLWGEVVRDVAQLIGGGGQDEVVKALEESSAICERFIGHGGDEELVKRIDEVIAMLGGD